MNFSEKHTCLLVQGSQAAEFLQGQITIDVEKISNEDFKPACICNNKGRVITTFWIKKVEIGFKIAILEELSASFEEHMNKYIPFFDAELKNNYQDHFKKELDSTEWMKFLINKGIVEINKNTQLLELLKNLMLIEIVLNHVLDRSGHYYDLFPFPENLYRMCLELLNTQHQKYALNDNEEDYTRF